jgi:hypothetical protein
MVMFDVLVDADDAGGESASGKSLGLGTPRFPSPERPTDGDFNTNIPISFSTDRGRAQTRDPEVP